MDIAWHDALVPCSPLANLRPLLSDNKRRNFFLSFPSLNRTLSKKAFGYPSSPKHRPVDDINHALRESQQQERRREEIRSTRRSRNK
jgi:hypothetical protein